MNKFKVQLVAIITVVFCISSCSKDGESILKETAWENEYQIKVNDEVFDEGKSMLAGINTNVLRENSIIASAGIDFNIYFETSKYNAGAILETGTEDEEHPNITAGALIYLRYTDANNGVTGWYHVVSGTTTIVSKKRIEFNYNCYLLADLDFDGNFAPGAKSYKITGYITEKNPQ